ncbi:MAG: zinc ribbon domain-containing protein [Candidatus Thorarchaeota archaeon]|nr:zinc ribbon domain-containing protein [Candidatus Thorarchaeota archaeon]
MRVTRFEKLLFSGIVLISIGLLILSLGANQVEGFFFLFPFLFVGNLNPFFAVAVLFFLAVALYLSFKWFAYSVEHPIESVRFVRVTKRCPDCGGPIPDSAVFCPTCGHPLDDQYND